MNIQGDISVCINMPSFSPSWSACQDCVAKPYGGFPRPSRANTWHVHEPRPWCDPRSSFPELQNSPLPPSLVLHHSWRQCRSERLWFERIFLESLLHLPRGHIQSAMVIFQLILSVSVCSPCRDRTYCSRPKQQEAKWWETHWAIWSTELKRDAIPNQYVYPPCCRKCHLLIQEQRWACG